MKNLFRKPPASVKESFTGVKCLLTPGEQLRQLRLDLGYSQSVVADRAGISLGLLSEIERGIAPNANFLGCVEQVLIDGAIERITVAASVLKRGLKRHAA